VVRVGEAVGRTLVDEPRDLLDRAAGIAEDQRRAVAGDRAPQLGAEGGPERVRLASLPVGVGAGECDIELDAFVRRRCDDLDRSRSIHGVRRAALDGIAAHPSGNPVERTNRCRQCDPL